MTIRHGHAQHGAHQQGDDGRHDHGQPTHAQHAHGAHDHAQCAHADARRRQAPIAMAEADRLCRERGVRLTDLRRSVLAALYETHRPLGAYDLAEILAGQSGKRIAPVTVYRVLEFLTGQGFVHRLVTRNAFIACPHQHDAGDVTVFLICARCGGVDELESPAINTAIGDLLKTSQFTPAAKIVEIDGICAHCHGSAGTPGGAA
ncbi:Fur family transcriptional regulator [Camelimonas sp. ID_303_24]